MARKKKTPAASSAATRRNFFRVWRVNIPPQAETPKLPERGELIAITSTRQDAKDRVRNPRHARVLCSAGVPGNWCDTIFSFRRSRGTTYLEGIVQVAGSWLAVSMHVLDGRLHVQTLERTGDGDGPPASEFDCEDETTVP